MLMMMILLHRSPLLIEIISIISTEQQQRLQFVRVMLFIVLFCVGHGRF